MWRKRLLLVYFIKVVVELNRLLALFRINLFLQFKDQDLEITPFP